MGGPFATAANQLTSTASRTASLAGKVNGAVTDMIQISDLIERVYAGTNGGADVRTQAVAVLGALTDVRVALKRLEDDLRAAASRAARAAGGA